MVSFKGFKGFGRKVKEGAKKVGKTVRHPRESFRQFRQSRAEKRALSRIKKLEEESHKIDEQIKKLSARKTEIEKQLKKTRKIRREILDERLRKVFKSGEYYGFSKGELVYIRINSREEKKKLFDYYSALLKWKNKKKSEYLEELRGIVILDENGNEIPLEDNPDVLDKLLKKYEEEIYEIYDELKEEEYA